MHPGGWWLAIESSNPSVMSEAMSGAIAVARLRPSQGLAPAIESPIAVEPIRQLHDAQGRPLDDLPGAVDRCLQAAGITLRDLRGVAVSVGPGGFTSVRSACCYAGLLAEGLSARRPEAPCLVAAVPTAAACALTLHTQIASLDPRGPVMLAMASKGQQAWCCRFPGLDVESLLAEQCAWARSGRMLTAAEVAVQAPALIIADRHVPASFALGTPTVAMALSAQGVLQGALACCQPDATALQPIYPREPEAVTLWNQRAAKG